MDAGQQSLLIRDSLEQFGKHPAGMHPQLRGELALAQPRRV